MSLRQASTQAIVSVVSLAIGLAVTPAFSWCIGDDTRPAGTTVDLSPLRASMADSPQVLVEDGIDKASDTAVSLERSVSLEGLAHELAITGSIASDGELKSQLSDFQKTIGAFEASGGKAAVVIRCLDTGSSLAYNQDELMYPASSIKGPYVISLYQALERGTLEGAGSDGEKAATIARLAKPVIVSSDNDSYIKLHDAFGGEVFADWCAEQGICQAGSDAYERLRCRDTHYPFVTCAELAAMWQAGNGYLASGSDKAGELRGFFDKRKESPLREGVGELATTISKAGWYPKDTIDKLAATVDAGIVTQDGRTYVVAIMTNAPADLDRLAALVPGIWTARAVLM